MTAGRRDISNAGGAADTALTSQISSGATTFVIDDATGWPTGGTYAFEVIMDRGGAAEEHVLCQSRSGTTVTVATSGRGYDSTSAAQHAAGTSVQLGVTAEFLGALNLHTFDTTRDDHTQYLNTTRHAAVSHGTAMLDLAALVAAIAGTGLDVSGTTLVVDPEEFTASMAGHGLDANVDLLDVDETELDIALIGGVNPAILNSLLTSRGDIIRRGASAPERLALGTSGFFLKSDGTDAVWSALPAASSEQTGGDLKYGTWTTAPTNWQLVDGTTVTSAQSLYTETWANTPAGWHSGANLVLPDWQGLMPVMLKGTDTDFDTIGKTGGAKSVTLSAAESGLPSHQHTIGVKFNSSGAQNKAAAAGSSTTDDTYNSGATGGSAASSAHQNLPPFAVVNWAIRLK